MQGFKEPIDKTRRAIASYGQFATSIRMTVDAPNAVLIMTEIEKALTEKPADVVSRFEAYKDEEGWHVYLIAVFKNIKHYGDIRKIFHLDLRKNSRDFAPSLLTLELLIKHGGQWCLMNFMRSAELITDGRIDLMKVHQALVRPEIPVVMVPKIQDIAGLQQLLVQIKQ